jgi:hypothetical protein
MDSGTWARKCRHISGIESVGQFGTVIIRVCAGLSSWRSCSPKKGNEVERYDKNPSVAASSNNKCMTRHHFIQMKLNCIYCIAGTNARTQMQEWGAIVLASRSTVELFNVNNTIFFASSQQAGSSSSEGLQEKRVRKSSTQVGPVGFMLFCFFEFRGSEKGP